MLTGVIINIVSTGLIMGSSGLRCGEANTTHGLVGGSYYENGGYTEIYICAIPGTDTEIVKKHEIGHYIWRKKMTEAQRDQYTKAYERDKKKGVKYFYRPYSMTNVEEDFADNYSIKNKRQNIRIQQRINILLNFL